MSEEIKEVDAYKIFKQLEERKKRATPYTFYDKDELIDEILKQEDGIEDLQQKVEQQEKEIERLNNIINRIDNFVDRTIELIKQQPSDNDEWILERLNGIKYLKELKEE